MRPDKGKLYYTAYEKRYRSAYEQGADSWISPPEEKEIREKVANYIERFGLIGRRVVEFGCGEGVAGLLFAKSGYIYQGYDISPAAIKKATVLLSEYTHAEIRLYDVVLGEFPEEAFDAGIDIQCIHMLITDADRREYLRNVYKCLKSEAMMYFIHERYRDDIYDGEVTSYEQWLELTGEDVDTPQKMVAVKDGKEFPVMMPLIASRPRTERGYREELTEAGFEIIDFERSEKRGLVWADILVKKAR